MTRRQAFLVAPSATRCNCSVCRADRIVVRAGLILAASTSIATFLYIFAVLGATL